MGALLKDPICDHRAQALYKGGSAHPSAAGQNQELCDETRQMGKKTNQAEETNLQIQTTCVPQLRRA